MIDKILQIIAPHHCYGCAATSTLLCENCKYDIINEPFSGCIHCRRPTDAGGVCGSCRLAFAAGWVIGERDEALKRLIDGYKFHNQKEAADVLIDLLDRVLPFLPSNVMIVPIPTISPHVRRRGYDHMQLIARGLANRRRISYSTVLKRKTNRSQLGADMRTRREQAKEAFTVSQAVNPDIPYLLLDDIYTTGTTMEFAAKALKDAGATEVWAAVIARQPLESGKTSSVYPN